MVATVSFLELIIVLGILIALLSTLVVMFRNLGAVVTGGICLFVLMGLAFSATFFLSGHHEAERLEQASRIQEEIPPGPAAASLAELQDREIAGTAVDSSKTAEDEPTTDAEQQEQAAIEAELVASQPKWIQASDAVLSREQIEEAAPEIRSLPDTFVVRSGLWSTEEEAIAEADQLAQQLINAKAQIAFTPQFNEESIRRGVEQNEQLLGRVFTQTRVVKLTPEVETEMVRAYLEVNTTPEELQAFTPVVRHYAAQERLKISGVVLAVIVVLAVLMSLIIDWRGKSRPEHPAR